MSNNSHEKLLAAVDKYYSEKIIAQGPVPQGVDWNGAESQTLRYEQLLKIVSTSKSFSINDVGCGYAGLYTYLKQHVTSDFQYVGIDISREMLEHARKFLGGSTNATFFGDLSRAPVSDYSVASGVYNVKLDSDDKPWQEYVLDSLTLLDQKSRRGFSFNILTSYSDLDKRRPHLYYANPSFYFDYCKTRFSKNVALLHDYGLYEFTVLVRKEL